MREWLALTQERDQIVRNIHVEVSEGGVLSADFQLPPLLQTMRKEMDHTLQQLHYWMQSALTSLSDKERDVLPTDLRQAVVDCYVRVHKYLVTLRGVPVHPAAAADSERDAPDGESAPTPTDHSADSKPYPGTGSTSSAPEPVTPFDEQSIVSDATFESAISNNSQVRELFAYLRVAQY